ncbi:MAG: hypothetical protein NTU60_07035 [Candidatus Aminicenantes bacterium]|nr:hypothetical protein [Candidatus Aminicenantes bacterium]
MKPTGDNPMAIKNRIENEIEETLRCFEAEAPPAAGPHFYAAVRRKIRNLTPAPPLPVPLGFRRRILVPAVLVLMVVLNIVTAALVSQAKKTEIEAKQQGLAALAEDYSVGRIGYASYLK